MRALHYGLLALLSLTIVASLKAVGIILVVAMLIAPGAIAYLLTNRFERMLPIAAAVAVGSSVAGTIVSFHIDGATGPCIVLIQMAVFLAAFAYASARQHFGRRASLHRLSASRRSVPLTGLLHALPRDGIPPVHAEHGFAMTGEVVLRAAAGAPPSPQWGES